MLTALFLMWLLGGSTPEAFVRDDFRAVSRVVAEPARAAATTKSMERVNAELERNFALRVEILEQFIQLDDRVGATRGEYEGALAPLWTARREAQMIYVGEVFTMRDNMTREEWDQVFGPTP
jgi:hypothetical protein